MNRFNTIETRLKEVKAIIVDKQARRDEVEYFIEDLKKQDLLTCLLYTSDAADDIALV